jgi:hypothetical protein
MEAMTNNKSVMEEGSDNNKHKRLIKEKNNTQAHKQSLNTLVINKKSKERKKRPRGQLYFCDALQT